jgi:DNA-binding NtrC family response regulator
MITQLKSETQPEISRVLEIRRAASVAGEVPGSWMLNSPGLSEVVEMASRLAQVPGLPILIQGERGTGVGELARMIHTADPLAGQRNLRIVPANQIGLSDTRGLSVEGTRFIEDIENLRPIGQEWLTEMMASRTKSSHPLRIIGGSRLSVGELLRCDGLNQELIHAMDVGRLVIPPLRTRAGDILPLATRFLRHYAEWQNRPRLRFSEGAERKLLSHTYPANVRELRNIVERAAALATSNEVGEREIVVFDEAGQGTQLRADLFRPTVGTDGPGGPHFPTLEEVERDYLTLLVREFHGQRTAIARTMGVSYPTVGRMIANFGIDVRAIVQAATAPVEVAG